MSPTAATLVAAIVLGAGCATAPAPVATEDQGAAAGRAPDTGCPDAKPAGPAKSSSEVCFVRADPLTPPIKVANGHAYSESLFGEREIVAMDATGTIYESGVFGNREVGTFRCGKLTRRGAQGDTLAATVQPGGVVAEGHTYSRGPGCDDAEAALGALALMIVQERNAEAAPAKKAE